MIKSAPAAAPARIDRAFVRLASGQVHFRSAGADTTGMVPLYMAHAGPGSSLGLVPMIGELGHTRRVIAPDMPGNGDSDPPGVESTDLAYYVDAAVALLDALGIEKVDFYGQHTGAHIGVELALAHPTRVRRLVLDGIALFDADLKAQMSGHYAPELVADDFGGHLAWAWTFVRDLTLHFPYFLRDPAHRLNRTAVPPPAVRHPLVVDLLKALPTWHLAYHAVFAHRTAERLPLLALPTLVMGADGDPLADYIAAAAAMIPGAITAVVPRTARHQPVQDFLDGPVRE